ncbi:MAG TPA: hypothetical protein VLA45_10500 [Paracoccaceae bacterium]|nr:hypothetical protein [Paracoccaceae bacterium]
MAGSDHKQTREERLAAQLRENLRRRKAQARAIGHAKDDPPLPPEPSLHKGESSG